MRRRTDVDLLVELLADGQWHSQADLIRRAFDARGHGMTVNSRASNARERGYAIEHRHDASAGERGAAHLYKLHGWFAAHQGCGGVGVKHIADVGFACKACHLIRRDLLPTSSATPTTARACALSRPEEELTTAGPQPASASPPSSGPESATALDAEPTEGPGVGAGVGPETRGGSSETDEDELGEPEPASWFADRAPVLTTPEAAGSIPAPRSHPAFQMAEVVSLLERRGFMEATDERIAELPPDPDQASLFEEYEEVA